MLKIGHNWLLESWGKFFILLLPRLCKAYSLPSIRRRCKRFSLSQKISLGSALMSALKINLQYHKNRRVPTSLVPLVFPNIHSSISFPHKTDTKLLEPLKQTKLPSPSLQNSSFIKSYNQCLEPFKKRKISNLNRFNLTESKESWFHARPAGEQSLSQEFAC